MDTNFYDRLGINNKASDEEIRKAYREAARRLHPDVNVEAGATEIFLNIKEAYEVLIDPTQRASYDGKNPKDLPLPPPVRVDTVYSRSSIVRMDEEQLHYALLEMEVMEELFEEDQTSPPTNIALVLDCSTSMQGARLDVVKASAIEIFQQLRPQDIISLIAFNDKANVIIPAGPNAEDKRKEVRIRMLQASGGTEIFQGLEAGLNEVRRNLHPSYINHIILITDGHTYGDEDACRNLAQQSSNLGISISCLGIGSEWNDAFLDELAKITGGSCIYISKPNEINQLLKQKFEGLGQIDAERIQFNFLPGSGVKLRYAFRLKPEVGVLSTSSPIKLGNIPKGSRQRVLLEFIVEPISREVDQVLLAEGDLTFDIPKRSEKPFRIPIAFVRTVLESIKPEPPPHVIVEAMSRLTLYRMQDQAKLELEAGNFDDATKCLQNMATHLFAQGEPELAKTVLHEAQNIQQHQEISREGDKRIKYGTRALLLPVGQRN
jgi:Ca-activated chloride channel family protein